jgi:hypothetical protein
MFYDLTQPRMLRHGPQKSAVDKEIRDPGSPRRPPPVEPLYRRYCTVGETAHVQQSGYTVHRLVKDHHEGNRTYGGHHSINPRSCNSSKFPTVPRRLIGAVLKLIIGAVSSAKSQGDLRLEFRFPKPRPSDRVIRRSEPETDCPTSCLAILSTRHSLIGIDLFKTYHGSFFKGSAVDVGVGEFINYTIVPESRYLFPISAISIYPSCCDHLLLRASLLDKRYMLLLNAMMSTIVTSILYASTKTAHSKYAFSQIFISHKVCHRSPTTIMQLLTRSRCFINRTRERRQVRPSHVRRPRR